MAYKAQPRQRRRDVETVTTPSGIYIHNGTTHTMAWPVFYREILPPILPPTADAPFDRSRCHWWCGDHCHHGYTQCNLHSCRHYMDMSKLIPVHFIHEGYNAVIINFEDTEGYIEATGEFDTRYDWVIRLKFKAHMPATDTKPKKVRYSLYVTSADKKDLVNTGYVTIYPAVREDIH